MRLIYFQSQKSGRVRGSPCVFPFITDDGIVHQECTTSQAPDGTYWCSTKVTAKGNHISGNWGHCQDNCPRKLPEDAK